MKRYQQSFKPWCIALGVLLGGSCHSLFAAGQKEVALDAGPKTQPGANEFYLVSKIPQSTFVVPTTDKDGKDPFFPDSGPKITAPVSNKETYDNSSRIVELSLQGISGPQEQRIAVINNRNFKAGEKNQVLVPGGSIQILCVEIKAASVVIEINGERRELSFQRSK